MTKRVISVVLAVVMVLAVFSGCGTKPTASQTPVASSAAPSESATPSPSESATPEAKKPVELTLWVGSREQDDYTAGNEKKFLDEHPYITLNKVVHEGDAGNDYFQGLAAGNAPDLVSVSYAMMPKYMAAGALLPLNDYIKNWDEYKNFLPSEQAKWTDKNGNVYGIVQFLGVMQMAYNKKLLDEAGITKLPTTWDELLADAKLLTKPDKQQAGFATLIAQYDEWFFQYYVWQAGGDLTKKNADGTAALTFTDPAVITAAKFYQQLMKDKVLPTDVNLTFNDLVAQFATDKIAMMPFAGDWVSWAVSLGAKPENIVLGLMPAGPNGVQGLANSYGGCYVINPNISKEKQDAAFEYISFYLSRDYMISDIKNKASKGVVNPVPLPRTDIKYSDAGVSLSPENQAFLDASLKSCRDEFYGKATFGKYIQTAVQKIMLDLNSDPAKEFQAAQDLAANEALNDFNATAKGN